MTNEKRVLIVEDDADISMVEEAYLEAAGIQTVIVTDGTEVSSLLDIAKPFDPAELVARVNANLRQYDRMMQKLPEEKDKQPEEIQAHDLRILVNSWKVYKGDKEIKFPNREFELLKFLAMNPNIVFSKEQLFEKIWGYDYVGDNATVMVHINRIREKIEDESRNPKILETVWGAGYRFNK